MNLRKTLSAIALGAIIGACLVEGNHSAGNMVTKSKNMIKEKIDEMKNKNNNNNVQ